MKTITGDKALDKALRLLGQSEINSVTRAGVRAASANVAKLAKADAKKIQETGALWRAIGVKSVKVDKRYGDMVGRIGPRSLWVRERKTGDMKRRFSEKTERKIGGRNPVRYAHMVEFGTRRGTPEYKVFRKGLFGQEGTHRQIAVAAMKKKLPAAIERARKKAGGKK